MPEPPWELPAGCARRSAAAVGRPIRLTLIFRPVTDVLVRIDDCCTPACSARTHDWPAHRATLIRDAVAEPGVQRVQPADPQSYSWRRTLDKATASWFVRNQLVTVTAGRELTRPPVLVTRLTVGSRPGPGR